VRALKDVGEVRLWASVSGMPASFALAGNMAKKKVVPESGGSFPVSGVTFVLLLVGTVLIVGVLSFFPAISLGPIVEHFLMVRSNAIF